MFMLSTIQFPGQVGSVELTLMVETKTASRWPSLCPSPLSPPLPQLGDSDSLSQEASERERETRGSVLGPCHL